MSVTSADTGVETCGPGGHLVGSARRFAEALSGRERFGGAMKAADPRVARKRRVSRRLAGIRMPRMPSFHVPWRKRFVHDSFECHSAELSSAMRR